MDTKKLRQKILDLAIHGKLVPQDPNDEPASVLLERIKAEKERLIKEGKIKRSKKSAKTSDTPHYPYLLPNGWEWCKLEDIVSFGGGKTPSMDNKEYWDNGKHLWVTSKDMKCSHITNSLMKITDKALKEMTIYEKGTLLVVTRSGILRHTLPLSILEKPATVNQDLKTISPHIQELSEYLYIVIKANERFILKEYHKDGTTVDSIDFDKFRCLPIPLAPFAEQKHIIVETKRWFALIDQMEQCKLALPEAIKQAKNKILDLAIHGKLVPQDPNDEPASELLKRINPKAEITCDNGHYQNVPNSWCITDIKSSFTINPKNKVADDVIAGFVPMTNILDGYSNEFRFESRLWGDIKKGFTHFTDGDIVVAKISPCLENRKSVIVTSLPNGIGAGTTELFVFRSQCVLPKYGLYFFKSDFFINHCVGTFNGVVGQQRVSKSIIENIKFPLPPISEQRRIVDAVHKVFAKLDAIMESL